MQSVEQVSVPLVAVVQGLNLENKTNNHTATNRPGRPTHALAIWLDCRNKETNNALHCFLHKYSGTAFLHSGVYN